MSQPSMSQPSQQQIKQDLVDAIRMLERAGLLRRSVVGRDHVLSLNAAPLAEAQAWIEKYRRFWEGRLAALDAFVTRKNRNRK